jgi:hypothetical protein
MVLLLLLFLLLCLLPCLHLFLFSSNVLTCHPLPAGLRDVIHGA